MTYKHTVTSIDRKKKVYSYSLLEGTCSLQMRSSKPQQGEEYEEEEKEEKEKGEKEKEE